MVSERRNGSRLWSRTRAARARSGSTSGGVNLFKPTPVFARATVGYDDNGSNAIDVRRQKTVALVGTSDGAIPAGEGAGSAHLRPTCQNSSYMFGIGFTSGLIYKSTDGSTWTTTGVDTGVVGVTGAAQGNLFAKANGGLVQFRYGGAPMTVAKNVTDTGGLLTITSTGAFANALTNMWVYVKFADTYTDGYFKINRVSANVVTLQGTTYSADTTCTFSLCTSCLVSSDHGATFTVADFKPNVDTTSLVSAYIPGWSFFEYGGVLMVAEYGTAGTALLGRYIHKSTDGGATWTRVADLNDYSASGYHFHCISYHAATGRWLAFYGDSSNNGSIYSANGGTTWTQLNTPLYGIQPICALDTGDATRLLVGHDGSAGISWIDVTTGLHDVVFDGTDHRDGRNFIFMLCKYAGVYYAGGYDNQTSPAPCLYASTDLVNWSVYHKFTVADAVYGFAYGYASFAGEAGGKLHFTVQALVSTAVPRHFSITPANVRNVGGTLITPAITNLLNANGSSFETSAALRSFAYTTITQQAVPFIGTYSARIVTGHATTGECGCRTGAATATDADITLEGGKTYVIKVRLKSAIPCRCQVRLWKGSTTSYGTNAYDTYWVVDADWRTFSAVIPIESADGADNYHIALYFYQTDNAVPLTIYADALQIAEAPVGEFALGGTPQAADILTETITTPAEWTDIFAVQSLGRNSYYVSAADQVIKTWKVGSDELLLFWDVSESKFTIQRNAETAVASAAQEWHPNQIIKFALRSDASGLTLDIQNGRASAQITDSALAALNSAAMTMIYGDLSSANQFPGVYFDGSMAGSEPTGMGFYPTKLTDTYIAYALNLKP